jgi:uncharacterized protein (TIGR00725 family)
MTLPTPIIGVMGPGTGATPDDCRIAYDLGYQIGQQGWVLLTGGRNVGVMDAASRGAKAAAGLTVGILPGRDRTQMSEAIDIPIVTAMGNARNAINVLSSNIVIACGMGSGTASEIALALKENKPIILLNSNSAAVHFFQQQAQTPIWIASTPDEVIVIVQRELGR